MSELFKVAGPAGEPSASVLLVHGLGGHAYDTWRCGVGKRWHADKTFWPRWLVDDDATHAVYTISHNAPVSRLHGTALHFTDQAISILRHRAISAPRSWRWASVRAAPPGSSRRSPPIGWRSPKGPASACRSALSTGNQGVALMVLAERTDDERMARTALSQIELALATAHDGGHDPHAACYAAQLPKAQALVERLSKR